MVLSMVPIDKNESIKIFFRFRCTKRKGKSFLLCKMTNTTNKRFVIFNKRKFTFDNINRFV